MAEAITSINEETEEEKLQNEEAKIEEMLIEKGVGMLEYEKQLFLDMLHAEGLVVCAK